jgi:putative endopeptidase
MFNVQFKRFALVSFALLAMLQTGLVQAAAGGIDLAGMDPEVRPQDDLFNATNGGWLKDTTIPDDKSDIGTFIVLRDRSDERVHAILDELAASSPTTGVEQKLAWFYRGYMDEAAIEKAGLAPAAPWLRRIDAVKNRRELAVLLGQLCGIAGAPIGLRVSGDPKEPGINRVFVMQGGLGLTDRDYYLNADERFGKAREAYLAYIEKLLSLSGDMQAAQSAQAVFAFEKRLAQAQWSRVDNRDPVKTYNPMTMAALRQAARGFDWPAYFKAAALPPLDKLSVMQPSYAQAAAKALNEVSLTDWKRYLRVRLLDSFARVLPAVHREAAFAFHGKALQGLQQDKPRWQHAMRAVDDGLGQAVGQIYVARHFPPAAKQRMQELVANLMATYAESIDALTWMSPETKQRAQAKLAKYGSKIGYPEKWRDYSKFDVREGDAFGNAARAGRFEWERMARQAGKPVDRSDWFISPQTVNAFYNPRQNEIVFPAAILQAPFFDMDADDAANYGAIGAVIGHEISHGFDDSGSQYDGDGSLNNWWTEADRKAFKALGDKLAAQFDAYEPLPGRHVNGRLTLGENIADLSGLQIAYKAYHRSLRGQAAPVLDGLSGDQRFFYAWARNWRGKVRDERRLMLLTSDTHSPSPYRANGAAVNSDGFQDTFGVKPGDRMYKPSKERIRIW